MKGVLSKCEKSNTTYSGYPASGFGSCGAAQAQGIYEAIGLKVVAREGGAAELAGKVVLFRLNGNGRRGNRHGEVFCPTRERGTPMLMRDNQPTSRAPQCQTTWMRIRSRLPCPAEVMGTSDVFTLEGVRLDLRDASAPVTATISGDSNVIISDVVEVISSIEEALEVESTMDSILTRGDMGSVTVTIKEAFSSVFEARCDGAVAGFRCAG